jgi:RsiW-degrading membrane proteinase PrsW (M82 family)
VRAAVGLLLSIPPVVWTAELLAGTPLLILASAIAPAVLLAAIIVFAQRGDDRSRRALLFSLAWGATGAAFLSTVGNEHARGWIDAHTPGDDRLLTAVLVAPLLEESAKALGIVLLRIFAPQTVRGARDGIVYGALVGVGFVFTENLLYLGISMLEGGEAGLLRGLYLRGVLGAATHVVFSACAGAGIAWSAAGNGNARASRLAPLAGFLFALVQHIAWNAFAAPSISRALCGSAPGKTSCREVPTGFALFGESTLVAVLFLGIGAVAVAIAWHRKPTMSRTET